MSASAAIDELVALGPRQPLQPTQTWNAGEPAVQAAQPDDTRRAGELAFHALDGPLVVVCGLHGGAGTSTLAYLLASYSAQTSSTPVLLCEGPGASGDQTSLSNVRSQVSLAQLTSALAAGRRPAGKWWAQRDHLRVLATAPQQRPDPPADADTALVLQHARAEHGLTVIDAGQLRDPSAPPLLASATHVIWALTAHPAADDLARNALASDLVAPLAARQALALRAPHRAHALGASVRDVRRVAQAHVERLLLIPERPALTRRPLDLAREQPLARELSTLARFLTP